MANAGTPAGAHTPVAIVGAGPVGLSLALGLARYGVRSVLIERNATTSEYSKAGGLHVRTREVFRQWGVEQRFLGAGVLRRTLPMHNTAPGGCPLPFSDFSELDDEADRAGILFLEQSQTERLLLDAVRDSGLCDVRFSTEAIALSADEDGVRLTLRQRGAETALQAEFLVGCDGASSFVRTALGLPFDGITYSIRPMIADVRVQDERDGVPWPRVRNSPGGLTSTFRFPSGLWRIIRLERSDPAKGDEVPREELGERVAEVLGEGPFEVAWASRFRIHLRHSPRFRVGRVLLAGDAAHVHSPAGGLGMNAGIQDAHNLAWKVAYALRGGDVDRLLDSYEVERKAVVVENVSGYTDLITRLFLQAPWTVREVALSLLGLLLKIPRARRRNLRSTTMIALDYPASPLLARRERSAGMRLPNPALRSPDGTEVRLYDLLPNGPLLLEVAEERAFSQELPIEHALRIGPGAYADPSGLLRGLLGGKAGWILVRPDAHVAWARESLDGIEDAISRALGVSARQLATTRAP